MLALDSINKIPFLEYLLEGGGSIHYTMIFRPPPQSVRNVNHGLEYGIIYIVTPPPPPNDIKVSAIQKKNPITALLYHFDHL